MMRTSGKFPTYMLASLLPALATTAHAGVILHNTVNYQTVTGQDKGTLSFDAYFDSLATALSDSNTASGVISNVGFDLSPQTFSQTSNLGLTGWSVAYACDPGNPSCALTSFSVGGTKFKATSGNKTYTASSFNLTRYFLDTVTTQLIGPPQEGRQINYFKDSSVTIEEVATRGGATVPAPATITLMSLGVVGMAGMRRRARQAHRRR